MKDRTKIEGGGADGWLLDQRGRGSGPAAYRGAALFFSLVFLRLFLSFLFLSFSFLFSFPFLLLSKKRKVQSTKKGCLWSI